MVRKLTSNLHSKTKEKEGGKGGGRAPPSCKVGLPAGPPAAYADRSVNDQAGGMLFGNVLCCKTQLLLNLLTAKTKLAKPSPRPSKPAVQGLSDSKTTRSENTISVAVRVRVIGLEEKLDKT